MPYVPEDKRTTAYYLFEPKFSCRVPALALRTLEDIKMFGNFSTGDAIVDRELAKNDVHCMLSIAAMESIFRKGHVVKVVRYNDTKRIFDYIDNHLKAWKNLLTNSINRPPDFEKTAEELIYLSNFAKEVYVHARHLITDDDVATLFGKHLLARRTKIGMGRINAIRRQPQVIEANATTDVEEKAKGRQYNSMEKLFNLEREQMAEWK